MNTLNQELFDACAAGDAERLRAALAAGADPNWNPQDVPLEEETPLMAALEDGEEELRYSTCVRLLLEAGADPNEINYWPERYTPLSTLIHDPYLEPIEGQNEFVCTPEEYAASSPRRCADFQEMLRLLDAAGALESELVPRYLNPRADKCSENKLLQAILQGDVAEAERLLEAGADPYTAGDEEYPPLMLAARLGNLPMVQLLLSYGVDPQETAPYVWRMSVSSLYHASYSGNIEVVRELLPFFGNGKQRRRELTHALFPAVARGHMDIVQFLLDNGAKVNGRYYANAEYFREEPSQSTYQGHTPLMLAARLGNLPMVQLLLSYGADPTADSHYAWDVYVTAFYHAARSGNIELLRELLPFFKNGELRRRELSHALFPAAARGRVDILQFLIDQGANVNYHYDVTDICDDTYTISALIYTIINNQRAAHDLLRAHGAIYYPLRTNRS